MLHQETRHITLIYDIYHEIPTHTLTLLDHFTRRSSCSLLSCEGASVANASLMAMM